MDQGILERQKIRQSSGRLTQTKIQLCSYEMYQVELLDRMLTSVQKTEDAFIDVNNRIIRNINARKDRLNLINSRIQGISGKILALYNQDFFQIVSPAHFPKISTSESASNHPYQSIFYDNQEPMTLDEEIQAGPGENPDIIMKLEMPDMSSISLKKKLYNTRLRNKKEDLQQIVSGATKDITDITKLLLSLNKYHADVMSNINSVLNKTKKAEADAVRQEGHLGVKPRNVKSVAELMLFDSDINVYEEQNVQLAEVAEFNIRGKKTKYFSQKELDEMANKRLLVLKKQELLKQERNKLTALEKAPETIGVRQGQKGFEQNELYYLPSGAQDVDIQLEENLFGGGQDDAFKKYEEQVQKQKKRRQKRQEQGDPNMTRMEDNEEAAAEPIVEQKVIEDIAPSVRAKKLVEEQQQRREEEEQRIQQMIEERMLADPDTPIEQAREVVYQQLLQKKMAKQQEEMSQTREIKDFSRPAIALGTVLAAQLTAQIEKGQKLATQSTVSRQSTIATSQRAPLGKAPQGRPPPTTAPPKQAPPKGPPPAAAPKAPKAAEVSSNVPKAPPINWFYSWIKKEPFGDNVPQVASSASSVPMPEPIAKVKEQEMSDDSIDLSFIEQIGKGDPGDIFNETPKELSLAEQLAAAGSQLKKAPVKEDKELSLAEQLAAAGSQLKKAPVKEEPKRELTLAEQLAQAGSNLKKAPVKEEPKRELTLAEQLAQAGAGLKKAPVKQEPQPPKEETKVEQKMPVSPSGREIETIEEEDEELENLRDSRPPKTRLQTKPTFQVVQPIPEEPEEQVIEKPRKTVQPQIAKPLTQSARPLDQSRRMSSMDALQQQLTMRVLAMSSAKNVKKKKKEDSDNSSSSSSDSDE